MALNRTTSILTHHKCGSTWLSWMISTVLNNNGVAYSRSDFGNSVPLSDRPVSILQNAQYSAVKDHLATANLHFIRNPLSILVSAYYSHLSTHPTEGWERLKHQRRLLERCDFQEGMLLTLAFLKSTSFSPDTPGPFDCLQTWNYDDNRITTVRMEDAVLDPHSFLTLFLNVSGMPGLVLQDAEQFRFECFTGRKVGQIDETSHYRSGDPEAWRAALPRLVIDYVREEFRSYLERFYPNALSDSDGGLSRDHENGEASNLALQLTGS